MVLVMLGYSSIACCSGT